MIRAYRLAVTILLSICILLGGSGFILGKMACIESGKIFFSAGINCDCCDEAPKGTSISNKCCDVKNAAFTQAHFMPECNLLLKVHAYSPVTINVPVFNPTKISGIRCLSIPDPDGRRGNSAQSFLSIFRI